MSRNENAMQQCEDTAMDVIRNHAEIKELDAGRYQNMRLYGIMKFIVRQYAVKDIGNLSVMTMNAGIMKMLTMILTPLYKDLPLVSVDFMYVFNQKIRYLECFDLVLDQKENDQNLKKALEKIKVNYKDLDNFVPSPAWYDSLGHTGIYGKGKGSDAEEKEALKDWLEAVLFSADQKPVLSFEKKQRKLSVVKQYTDGLIDKGGVSTDFFVKNLGKENTRILFDQVLFGTERADV